jgi:hypothetical protein
MIERLLGQSEGDAVRHITLEADRLA